ncbi:MAG TPA: glycosyltransferase [Candidatus Angelobacter sp.]|nr:glycosyltransferase [Candidatus Angelobacter sp.]
MAERKTPRVVQMTSAHRALDARIFHKISKSLARSGYEVILVAGHEQDENIDGVHVAAVPKSRDRLRRMTVNLLNVYKRALQLDGDIYHFHDPELMPMGLLLRLRGKRVIYDAHEDLPRTVSYKDYIPRFMHKLVAGGAEKFELFAARRFTAVIAATPPIAERFYGINPNTVVVHNFPILEEIPSSQTHSWEKRDAAIAYVGGISRERSIFEILQALSHLNPQRDCRLALAGWFSPQELKSEIESLPGSGRVDWLGMLSRREIADLLARVRAGIVLFHDMPNLTNSKPTKLFEYMCAGIPVVASDFPLWREIVAGERCGLLVDPLKPAEIAGAISYLLDHPREAEAMGRRGRRAAERLFNWKSEEKTLLDLYQSILQPHELPLSAEINCA